jgi:8-hydroxy-5-deazaflavin:NADPH oxidoreductase
VPRYAVHVGILGGTGPLGRGLALRLAAGGAMVTLGSRSAERAQGLVDEMIGAWPDHKLSITGADNRGAAEAEVVVVATQWEAAVPTAVEVADRLVDKVVVSVANAMVKEGKQLLPLLPPRGSVAAEVQALVPRALVAAAGHHLPAPVLQQIDESLEADVLICSDHRRATEETMALVGSMAGLRPLDAGGLALAGPIEAFTAVLVALNIRYRVHSTLRLAGLDASARVPARAGTVPT